MVIAFILTSIRQPAVVALHQHYMLTLGICQVQFPLSLAHVILAYFIMLLQCQTGVNHISLMLVTMSHHNLSLYRYLFTRLGRLAWLVPLSDLYCLFLHSLCSQHLYGSNVYIVCYCLHSFSYQIPLYKFGMCLYPGPSPLRMLTDIPNLSTYCSNRLCINDAVLHKYIFGSSRSNVLCTFFACNIFEFLSLRRFMHIVQLSSLFPADGSIWIFSSISVFSRNVYSCVVFSKASSHGLGLRF